MPWALGSGSEIKFELSPCMKLIECSHMSLCHWLRTEKRVLNEGNGTCTVVGGLTGHPQFPK